MAGKGRGSAPRGPMKRPDVPPKILGDMLEEVQQAADLIIHVGTILKGPFGAVWQRRALGLYRDVIKFQQDIKRMAAGERLYMPPKSEQADIPKAMR